MKKIISFALAIVMLCALTVAFSSCAKNSDLAKIKEQGYFVCGITVYAPMNYFDETDTLVGFDTEFAKAVAAKMGVEAKFQIIDWHSKYMELNGGKIDCIWNGFTSNSDDDGVPRSESGSFTTGCGTN